MATIIGCLPTQALAFLAVYVYATHATQAIAFEWKPGFSYKHCNRMPLLYARRAVTIPQPDSITVLSGQYQIIRIVNLQFAFTLHVSEQLAQSDDIKVERPGVERTTS